MKISCELPAGADRCSAEDKMLQINMRISLRILTCEIDFNEDPTLRRAGFFFSVFLCCTLRFFPSFYIEGEKGGTK